MIKTFLTIIVMVIMILFVMVFIIPVLCKIFVFWYDKVEEKFEEWEKGKENE